MLTPDDVKAYHNLGVAYYSKGELDKAVEQYKKALGLAPDDAELHYLLGAAYIQLNNLDEALKEMEKAKELKPSLPEPYYGLGVIYKLKGEKEKVSTRRNINYIISGFAMGFAYLL